MRILFVHQNFAGQYAYLLRHYAGDPRNEIVFLTRHANAPFPGIRKIVYRLARQAGEKTHPYVRPVEHAVLHGQAVARAALKLKKEGFEPDVILGHNAWGETLFLKDIYPRTPLIGYFEFYYRASGLDVGFDPEFPGDLDLRLRVHTLNAVNLMGLQVADRGQTATRWQRSTYPERYQDVIAAVHEGVDTDRVRPDPSARLSLPDGRVLARSDEVVTYIARNLEPYRGFHVFMRAVPEIQRLRPKAHVVVVGGDDVSYGRKPTSGRTWREQLLHEVGSRIDPSRISFLGRLPYASYLSALQISSVHVYLTYPFVLSWSMLEAMAAGCVVVASGTPPVREVLKDGVNGLTLDFFDGEGLAERIDAVLGAPERFAELRVEARRTVEERFDATRVCLPMQRALVDSVLHPKAPLMRDKIIGSSARSAEPARQP
jgi:glycosyltransferase involved in cell wall biosynthesis